MAKPTPQKSAKKSPLPTSIAPAKDVAPTTTSVQGSAEALAEFLAEARAVPAQDVYPLRNDPALALHNIDAGLAAIAPRETELSVLPAPFEITTMRSLRRLALALIYAAAQVDRSSPGTTRKLISRAAELREILLTSAVALMKTGTLPEPKVKKIMSGKGSRDLAQDCVDLAQLFRDHTAALRGKTAVTKAQIDEAANAGNELLTILQPAHGKTRISADVKNAVDIRDRVWTLLWMKHKQHLRRAGMWLWVDDVDDHVPPLLSSRGATKKASKKDKPPSPTEE